MITFSTAQQAIADSDHKMVSWLFDVTTTAPTSYYWSTKNYTKTGELLKFTSDEIKFTADSLYFGSDSQEYTFKIIPSSFQGVSMRGLISPQGNYVGNELKFSIHNKDSALTDSDFKGATVLVRLVCSNGTYTEIMRQWKYKIQSAHGIYEKIDFICKDIVTYHAEGDYPTTPVADDLFPPVVTDFNNNKSSLCAPVPVGTCYIPIRCITDSSYNRGYLLGPDARTYTMVEVSSPRAFDCANSWSWGDCDFRQVTKTDRFAASDWKILHPFLIRMGSSYEGTHTGADDAAALTDSGASYVVDELIGLRIINETDGSAGYITDNDATTVTASLAGGVDNNWDEGDTYYITASGLWKSSGTYQDILANFYRDDSHKLTSPSDAIPFILEDMGVTATDINKAGSFDGLKATFDTRGLDFNGAFYYKQSGKKAIAELLNSCHCTIDITNKVNLRELSKTSQKTITDADVLREGETGYGSFRISYLEPQESDSGYVAYNSTYDDPQDVFLKLLVSAKSNTDHPSSETLYIPFVQDSENVQKAGQLYFQRRFLKEANGTFNGKSTLLALQPNDVITLDHTYYGGTYDVLIDTITINHNLSVSVRFLKFSDDLDDWDDLSPSAVTVSTDNAPYWSMGSFGPDSVTVTVPQMTGGGIQSVVSAVSGSSGISNFDDSGAAATADDTDGIVEGSSNLFHTAARVNAAIPNTDSLSEGSINLYFTIARAIAATTTRLFTDSTIKGIIEAQKITNTTEGNTASLNFQTAHETHTLAAAATSDTTINLATGCMLLGVSFCVNTAVSDDGGDDTWSAAFIGGSTTTLATAAAAAQNTKVDTLMVPEVASAQTNVQFTANGGSFDGGVIELVAYYINLTSLADA